MVITSTPQVVQLILMVLFLFLLVTKLVTTCMNLIYIQLKRRGLVLSSRAQLHGKDSECSCCGAN